MPESISVVIPALNEEALVEAAVRSVRDDAEDERLASAYDGQSLANAWPAGEGGRPLSSHGP
jgi:hypothetical protein